MLSCPPGLWYFYREETYVYPDASTHTSGMIRNWRIARAEDGRGLLVWFDPLLEDVTIRTLTGPERAHRLTEQVSVSASGPTDQVDMDFDYDEKHKELNGAS